MADGEWSVTRRVAFRFGVIAFALFLYPAPLGILPFTESLADGALRPWNALVVWFSESVLGTGTPPIQPTGSGDTLLAWVGFGLILILAALGTVVWTLVEHRFGARAGARGRAYPRLAAAMWIALRYMLAMTLLSYGFAKVIDTQFPPPDAIMLDRRVGDMSPMGMLWTFQGASVPYTIFCGSAEVLAAVLLLFRRTATLGALVAMGVMTNVLLLNLCYDVPVKLFAMQLLAIAFFVALPQLRRVAGALLGRAIPETPPRARSSVGNERLRLAAKVAVLAVLAWGTYQQVTQARQYRPKANELSGTWLVDRFEVAGVDQPPLAIDEKRWCRLLVGGWAIATKSCGDVRSIYRGSVNPASRTIEIETKDSKNVWHYALNASDQLTVDLAIEGKPVHVVAHRAPASLLMTRGFHWVQEFPYNR